MEGNFVLWVDFIKSCFVFLLMLTMRSSAAEMRNLTSETVQGVALTLQGIHDVHGCDYIYSCMLGVSGRVTDTILEEDLEDSMGLFINQTRDTLDTTTMSQTMDIGLSNTLDVIMKDITMPLGASLSKSFSSFSSARNIDLLVFSKVAQLERVIGIMVLLSLELF
jgi:hypothetical protein